MNLTDQLLKITLLGAEWVLWLLLALSIVSVALMVERFLFFNKRRIDLSGLLTRAKKAVAAGDAKALTRDYGDSLAMPVLVATAGIEAAGAGADAAGEAMTSEKVRQRQLHEQNLVILATLGNNAPFIGLFGTVLGIIQAFHDLQKNPEGGIDVVMGGVSEALIATAVGLFVAIPAVIAYNYFNRRVRSETAATDSVAHAILAQLEGNGSKADD